MRRHIRWLLGELQVWEHSGLVDPATAEKIREHYPTPAKVRPWGAIVFSSVGAVIFGLGVILFFAYNWEAMPKFAKLGLVFVALGSAHGSGYRLCKGGRHVELGEALHVLGTILFGAGIWLVAQIYHIDEHYPDAFPVWGGAALIMAWVTPSIAHGIIAAVVFVLWGGFEVFDFHHSAHLSPLLILFGIGPLVWVLRSRVLLITTAIALQVSVVFTVAGIDDDLILPTLLCLAASFAALGHLLRGRTVEPFRPAHLTVLGNVAVWILLYVLTFREAAEELLEPLTFENEPLVVSYFSVITLVAALLWVLVLLPPASLRRRMEHGLRWDHLVVSAVLVILISSWTCLGWATAGDGWAGAVIFNLLFVAGAISLMVHGCKTVHAGYVTVGSLLLASIVLTRYADLFESLLVRSLVFLLMGAGIFSIGIAYSKAKRRQQALSETPP